MPINSPASPGTVVQMQVTLSGMVLEQCLIREMVQQMEADVVYTERKKSVEEFNKVSCVLILQ